MELKQLPKIALGAWAWGNDGTFGGNLTADDLRRNTARIEPQAVMRGEEILESVLGYDHHQGAAQRHQKMGAEARILDPIFTIEADNRAA